MIQIVCCSCTQQKLRGRGVDFYSNKRLYQNIGRISVAPCSRHLFFKESISQRFNDIKCNCPSLEKGRCNNCKIICFNLNFLTEKIKITRISDVPAEAEIKKIVEYLFDIKSVLILF